MAGGIFIGSVYGTMELQTKGFSDSSTKARAQLEGMQGSVNKATSALSLARDAFTRTGSVLLSGLGGAANAVGSTFSRVFTALPAPIQNAMRSVGSAVSSVLSPIQAVGGAISGGIVRAFDFVAPKAQAAFGGIANFASGAVGQVRNVGGAFQEVVGQTRLLQVAVAAAAVGTVGFGLKFGSDLQVAAARMQSLTGNTQVAQSLFTDLYNFVRGTPLAFPDVANAAATLLGYGRTAEQVSGDVRVLGGLVATTGADWKLLANVYGQVNAAGRLMGQDALQLINNSIPIQSALAKQLGISLGDVKKKMEAGEISAAMFNTAIKTLVPPDAIEKMKNTMPGAISNLTGSMRLFAFSLLGIDYGKFKEGEPLLEVQGGLFQQIRMGILEVSKALSSVETKKSMQKLGEDIGNLVRGVLPLLVQGLRFVIDNISTLARIAGTLAAIWAAGKILSFVGALSRMGLSILSLVAYFTSGALKTAQFTASLVGLNLQANNAAASMGRLGAASALASTTMGTSAARTTAASAATSKFGGAAGLAGTAVGGLKGGLVGLAVAVATVGLGVLTQKVIEHKAAQEAAAQKTKENAEAVSSLRIQAAQAAAQGDGGLSQKLLQQAQAAEVYGAKWKDAVDGVPLAVGRALTQAQYESQKGTEGIVTTSLGQLRVLPDGAGIEFQKLRGAITPGMTDAQAAAAAIAEATKNDFLGGIGGIPPGIPIKLAGTNENLRAGLGEMPATADELGKLTLNNFAFSMGQMPGKSTEVGYATRQNLITQLGPMAAAAYLATSPTPEQIRLALSPAAGVGGAAGQSTIQALTAKLGEGPAAAFLATSPTPEQIRSALSGAPPAAAGQGGATLDAFGRQIGQVPGVGARGVAPTAGAVQGAMAGVPASGDGAGKGLMERFGDTLRRFGDNPIGAVRDVVAKIRSLLPGSDAKTGPLSDLGRAGMGLPQRLAEGIRAGQGEAIAAARNMAALVSTASAFNTLDPALATPGGVSGGLRVQSLGADGLAAAGGPGSQFIIQPKQLTEADVDMVINRANARTGLALKGS